MYQWKSNARNVTVEGDESYGRKLRVRVLSRARRYNEKSDSAHKLRPRERAIGLVRLLNIHRSLGRTMPRSKVSDKERGLALSNKRLVMLTQFVGKICHSMDKDALDKSVCNKLIWTGLDSFNDTSQPRGSCPIASRWERLRFPSVFPGQIRIVHVSHDEANEIIVGARGD